MMTPDNELRDVLKRNAELRRGVKNDAKRIKALNESLDRNLEKNHFAELILTAMEVKKGRHA